MPLYKSPRHGVTLSQALHEAAAIAPVSVVILHTFELWHSSLAEPIYVVNNFEDLLATKEATADRDPSTEVEFMASSIALQRPTETDAGEAPELELTVSNVSGVLSAALRDARGSPDLWEVIERLYDQSDTSGPAHTPMSLIVTGIDISTKTVTLRCSYGDPANVAVPRTTFRRSAYPGLVR
jgi:hypothetical protein